MARWTQFRRCIVGPNTRALTVNLLLFAALIALVFTDDIRAFAVPMFAATVIELIFNSRRWYRAWKK